MEMAIITGMRDITLTPKGKEMKKITKDMPSVTNVAHVNESLDALDPEPMPHANGKIAGSSVRPMKTEGSEGGAFALIVAQDRRPDCGVILRNACEKNLSFVSGSKRKLLDDECSKSVSPDVHQAAVEKIDGYAQENGVKKQER
ncbi:hypothetical protein IFM89_013976 [Coptis chinensis]|uniref:Uncharacterized protein n=1 Tax=Coptis chinensis TaxID=261450 RepID=A0A835IMZ0_9MAGN|nr:hypothetical protein IFM89_013976 [Coptis chinensis]